MAEIVGLVASAVTLAATAQNAAQLSKVVFEVISTSKHPPKEMNGIASELSLFSGSLQTIADIINHQELLCIPAFFENIKAIVRRYKEVETDIQGFFEKDNHGDLLQTRWRMRRVKLKNCLKRLEVDVALKDSIRTAQQDVTTSTGNHLRSAIEDITRAYQQDARSSNRIESLDHATGKRMDLVVWKEGYFDTATWLYYLVFGTPAEMIPNQEHSDESHAVVRQRRCYRASELRYQPQGHVAAGSPPTLNSPSLPSGKASFSTTSANHVRVGYLGHRPCLPIIAFMFLVIMRSAAFALYWTIHANAMGDAFTAASWFVAVGTLIAAVLVARHYPKCNCWKKKNRSTVGEAGPDDMELGHIHTPWQSSDVLD